MVRAEYYIIREEGNKENRVRNAKERNIGVESTILISARIIIHNQSEILRHSNLLKDPWKITCY